MATTILFIGTPERLRILQRDYPPSIKIEVPESYEDAVKLAKTVTTVIAEIRPTNPVSLVKSVLATVTKNTPTLDRILREHFHMPPENTRTQSDARRQIAKSMQESLGL